jgi:hypothetical protein
MTKDDKEPVAEVRANRETATGLQCEHKLAVGLALLFTGLYDTQLNRALKKATYVKELIKEYAWSHERCNQVKGEDAYVRDDSPTDLVHLVVNDAKVTENLGRIWGGDYPSFLPLKKVFQERAGGEEGKPVWEATAREGIARGLAPVLTQVNGQNVTKTALYAHFRRGVLIRAKLAYDVSPPRPSVRTRPTIIARVPKRARVEGGATRRRKGLRRTRRVYRGGADDDYDALIDDATTYVALQLHEHYELWVDDWIENFNPEDPQYDAKARGLFDALAKTYTDFPVLVDAIVAEALGRSLLLTEYSEEGDELVNAVDASIDWHIAVQFHRLGLTNLSRYPDGAFREVDADGFGPDEQAPAAAAAALSVDTRGSQAPTLVASSFSGSTPPPTPPRATDNTNGLLSPQGSLQATPAQVAQASERPTEGRRRASIAADDVREALENSDGSLGGGFRFGRRPDWL